MRCARWLAISILAATAAVHPVPAVPAEIAGIDDAAHRALSVDARTRPLADFDGGAVRNDHVGFLDVVLIGDPHGRGARAYRSQGHHFEPGSGLNEVVSGNAIWRVTEEALLGPGGESLPRLLGPSRLLVCLGGVF
jgi:hypothetical protein